MTKPERKEEESEEDGKKTLSAEVQYDDMNHHQYLTFQKRKSFGALDLNILNRLV